MSDWATSLLVSAPAAVAVIWAVMLFLKHLREERTSRDAAQSRFLEVIEKLSEPIAELTIEVRMLRDRQDAPR